MNTSSFIALMGVVVFGGFIVFMITYFIREERKK